MSEIKTRKVVDEDWKARVQREKEEALKASGATPAPDVAATAAPDAAAPKPAPPAAAPAPAHPEQPAELDPAFEGLVSMLASQTMYCLGLMGGQGQVVVNLEQAKEFIDVLAMLRDKTRGNLVPEEATLIQETLAELQRLFAARVQQAQAQAMQQAGVNPQHLRGEPPR